MLKWTDTGIILKVIKQGEKGNLVNVLTNNHGRHMGWFNNYSKKQYLIQPGDIVNVSWSSRISNQLGFFKIELIQTSVGKIFDDEIRLNIISSFCSLISIILPEREICSNLFCKSKILLNEILNNVSIHETLKLYIYWELEVLNEIGLPLNFSKCAVSGEVKNLKFVSPKSGNAVGINFAGKYEKKLLKLPFFLGGIELINDNENNDILAGLELTLYFFKKFLNSLDLINISEVLVARSRLQNNLKVRYL